MQGRKRRGTRILALLAALVTISVGVVEAVKVARIPPLQQSAFRVNYPYRI